MCSVIIVSVEETNSQEQHSVEQHSDYENKQQAKGSNDDKMPECDEDYSVHVVPPIPRLPKPRIKRTARPDPRLRATSHYKLRKSPMQRDYDVEEDSDYVSLNLVTDVHGYGDIEPMMDGYVWLAPTLSSSMAEAGESQRWEKKEKGHTSTYYVGNAATPPSRESPISEALPASPSKTDADLVHDIMKRLQEKDAKISQLELQKEKDDKRYQTRIQNLEVEKQKDKSVLQELKSQTADLEKKLQEKIKENQKLKNTLEEGEKMAENSELQSRIDQQKISELKEALEKEKEKVEQKESEVLRLEIELVEAKLELEKKDNNYRDKIRAVESERDGIKVELAELKLHIAEQERREEEEKRRVAEEETRKVREEYSKLLEKFNTLQTNQ